MKRTAYLFVLAAAFLWGTIGFFVRSLLSAGFDQVELICFRAWISSAILLAIVLLKDPKLLRIRLRDVWIFVGSGIISFVFFTSCYFHAVELIPLSTAAILLYTSPIFVTIFSVWLFKEKFTARKALSLTLAFGGCILVSGFSKDGPTPFLGILLGIGSGFFYALYSIFGKYGLRRYAPLTVITYTFLFASAAITPFFSIERIQLVSFTPQVVLTLVTLCAGSGACAYLLYTKGLSHLPATDAAVAAILEPVVAALTGVIIFHETLSFISILGICLVLGAILILSLAPAQNASPDKN